VTYSTHGYAIEYQYLRSLDLSVLEVRQKPELHLAQRFSAQATMVRASRILRSENP
jgi:hypothetical protein